MPGAPDAGPIRWGPPLAVGVVGTFMTVLDTSIVNVAIPTMRAEFGGSTQDIQWIATAYTLCLGVVVPSSAWLGERLGLKRLYLMSLVGFAAASALCGMASGLTSMIVFRILQAVPAGLIPVTCQTMLYRMVPPERRGTAMGMYGFGVVVAPGIGPTLGGYLVEYVNWRSIFYLNLPIGLLGALAAFVVLPRFPPGPRRRFDLPGFGCIATGAFALLLAGSKGFDWGWTSYRVLMLLVFAALALALFVVIELEVDHPLLNVRVFRCVPYLRSLALIVVLATGMVAGLFYPTLFLQESQHITALNTGLTLMPQAMVTVVMMPLAGRLYDRIGARWPASVGLALAGVGTLLMAHINASMTRSELVVWMMIRAFGIGLALMPIVTAGLSALPPAILSAGSAFNAQVQRISGSLGLTALTAMTTAQQAQLLADRSARFDAGDPRVTALASRGPAGLYPLWRQLHVAVQATAYGDIFLVIGGYTLAGAVLALFLRGGDQAGSPMNK